MTNRDEYSGTWSYVDVATTKDGKATHPVPKTGGIYLPTG